jgi:hypothetical protein
MTHQQLETTLAGFLFKGAAASAAVDGLRDGFSQGLSIEKGDISAKVSLRLLDDELVEAAERMAVVYSVISAFENQVRQLIQQRLVEKIGADWWTKAKMSTEIKHRAETRQKDEEKIRWHKTRGLSPLFFTELGDLPSLIRNNWTEFEDLFHDPDWVLHVFKTLERSRNVIMHSGQLSMDDIERVGVTIRDWLRQVGG